MEKIKNKRFSWKGRRVLVTGCTGLLGSWLTRRLVDEGADVIGMVRDWVPRSNLVLDGIVENITTVRGAIEDYSFVERVLNEYEIEIVFHLAAQTLVGTANRSPLSTFESNIKGTWTLLEACRLTPHVKRVLIASSDKAYGNQLKLPYTEETPLRGLHPYDVSKSCADLISVAYYESYGLPVCITRCGNFYGGGDLNWSRIVPGTIVSVLQNKRPVIRSDGKMIRDYLYVEDGVAAYLTLAEQMLEKKLSGKAFNFSYESPQSVLAMTHAVLKKMKSPLKPLILNNATNEIPAQHLSAKAARRDLDWKPSFNLDLGLDRTIDWYRSHPAAWS